MMKFDILFRNGLDYQHNRKDLTSYFIREFKKAERDNFYTVETFFPPLYDRIERHKKGIKKNFESKKEALQKLLQKAKKNEKEHRDPYNFKCLDRQGINYEDFKKEENKNTVKNTQKELNNFTPESVISPGIFGFRLSEIKLLEENLKKAEKKLKPKIRKKIISDFIINVSDAEGFIKELKRTFPTEIGISIRAMIDILRINGLITYGTKEFKLFQSQLSEAFERDIGTYQSINDAKNIDRKISDPINQKLVPIISRYKVN